MSTHTVPVEQALTPELSVLTDQIGNEVYSAHYGERKAYRFLLGCGTRTMPFVESTFGMSGWSSRC